MQDSKKKCIKEKLDESCEVLEEISNDVKLLKDDSKEKLENGRKNYKREISFIRGETRISERAT